MRDFHLRASCCNTSKPHPCLQSYGMQLSVELSVLILPVKEPLPLLLINGVIFLVFLQGFVMPLFFIQNILCAIP